MPTVIIRTFIIYVIIEVSMKLMGKRQIGEFQLSELVTTLLLSELAALPISDPDIPLLYMAFPIALIISFEVITSFLSVKSVWARRFFSGKPSVLIRRGALDQRELRRLRISASELLGQLRQKGYGDITEINYAIVEDDGKLSVFPKIDDRPPNICEIKDVLGGQTPTDSGISHALIIDGCIIEENLRCSNKTRAFVDHQLRMAKCGKKDVLLLLCDDSDKVTLIRREKDPPESDAPQNKKKG